MVAFKFGEANEEVDIRRLEFLESGELDKGKIGGRLRKRLETIVPGTICAVEETHVAGDNHWPNLFVFKVGEKGIKLYSQGQKKVPGIEVMRETHPLLKAREAVVLRTDRSGFNNQVEFVSLIRGGVSSFTSWNEGTFSRSGGWEYEIRSGQYISGVYFGERAIMKINPDASREIELRGKSIPFVLPRQYIRISDGPFGDLGSASVQTMIEMFTEKGMIGRPKTREKLDELRRKAEAYCASKEGLTAAQKRYWTRTMNLTKRSHDDWEIRRRLFEEGIARVERGLIERTVLNAVGGCITNIHSPFSAYQTKNGSYEIWEKNEPYEKEGSEWVKKPRRGFELVPSVMASGLVYVIPKNESSVHHALRSLLDFNSRYPDTLYTKEHKVNFVPSSFIQ